MEGWWSTPDLMAFLDFMHDDADHLYDFRGLFWRRPLVTSVFVPMLLAQAGVPLTLGFLAKFYVLAAAVEQHAWILALAVVVGSAIGLYYYLRVVVVQFLPKPGMRPEGQWSEMSTSRRASATACTSSKAT